MHRVAKQFLFSEYQKVLVREGVVYFIVYVPPWFLLMYTVLTTNSVLAYAIICQLASTGRIPRDGRLVMYVAMQQTLPYMLFPRFVLSLREMYAQELQGRRGDGIDSAFGLGQSQHAASGHPVLFAGISRNTKGDDGMEMEMEMELRSQRDVTNVSA